MFDKLLTVKPGDRRGVYLIKTLIRRFDEHNISQTGGQLAFFFLLSMFPFLIYFSALIGSFHISTQMVEEFLTPIFPEQIVGLISSYVSHISSSSSVSLISIGVVVTIFSASKSVRSLSHAINTAYGVRDERGFLLGIVFSMAAILVFGIVILLLILLVTFSKDLLTRIVQVLKVPFALVNILSVWRWVTLVLILFLSLSMLYMFIPHKKLKFKEIVPGVVFSIVGFMLLTVGFSIYVNYFMRSSALYGTIGAVILLMLWLYIVSMIIVIGAEINCAVSIMPRKRRPYGARGNGR